MNSYESVIIVTNKISDEERKKVISDISTYIKKVGNLTSIDELGEKKLAYEVRKHTSAFYYVFNFETNANNIAELERIYRITDEILKFIVVRKDD